MQAFCFDFFQARTGVPEGPLDRGEDPTVTSILRSAIAGTVYAVLHAPRDSSIEISTGVFRAAEKIFDGAFSAISPFMSLPSV
jgi:hypothetical protein